MRTGAMMLMWLEKNGWKQEGPGYTKLTERGLIFIHDSYLAPSLAFNHPHTFAAFMQGYESETAALHRIEWVP